MPGQNPCSEEVFWKILKENKIKFTTKVRPTICPIHDKGPSDERALVEALLEEKRLQTEYARTIGVLDAQKAQAQQGTCQKEADERALSACTVAVNQAKKELLQMSQKVVEFEKKVAKYKMHLAQFETSRMEVNKIIGQSWSR